MSTKLSLEESCKIDNTHEHVEYKSCDYLLLDTGRVNNTDTDIRYMFFGGTIHQIGCFEIQQKFAARMHTLFYIASK